MDAQLLIEQAKRIGSIKPGESAAGALAEAREFLRIYAGEKSAFLRGLNEINQAANPTYVMGFVSGAMEAFIRFLENGLNEGISIERKAQLDVVSDLLDQANELLRNQRVHPAAPTVLIGSVLEEFLRTWVEERDISLGGRKPSLDSYSTALRSEDLITKQDAKDISSWGGLRNHAAHGEWQEVEDRRRISLMLEGVNLFMRKYGG